MRERRLEVRAFEAAAARTLVRELLEWYERHGRHALPWRVDRSPYRVVVAEFMLQQTQVERVVPLFAAFTASWPDLASLAAAPLADVLRAWKGLGYNSRAVRLHGLARTVAERFDGAVPSDPEALAALSGIGPYTLSAVLAFAFDRPVVAIDTNLRRVLHRVRYGLEWPPAATPAQVGAFGAEAAAEAGAGFALNSALMDLGATICTARAPKCLLCPLQRSCAAAPIDSATLAKRAAAHAPKRGPQARMAFEATTRYLRGRIVDRLRDVPDDVWLPLEPLLALAGALDVPRTREDVERALAALAGEGLIERRDAPSAARLHRSGPASRVVPGPARRVSSAVARSGLPVTKVN